MIGVGNHHGDHLDQKGKKSLIQLCGQSSLKLRHTGAVLAVLLNEIWASKAVKCQLLTQMGPKIRYYL
jgi:hypothetical protein